MEYTCFECKHLQADMDSEPCVNCIVSIGGRPTHWEAPSVIIHHLICKDTYDERAMDVLRGKDLSQQALLDALKSYLKKEDT